MPQDRQYSLDRPAIDEFLASFPDAANRFSPEDPWRLWAVDATWTIGPPESTILRGLHDIVAASTSHSATINYPT